MSDKYDEPGVYAYGIVPPDNWKREPLETGILEIDNIKWHKPQETLADMTYEEIIESIYGMLVGEMGNHLGKEMDQNAIAQKAVEMAHDDCFMLGRLCVRLAMKLVTERLENVLEREKRKEE